MGTPALLLDYLFAGAAIEQRLRSQVAELAGADAVRAVDQLAQAVERSITGPTAFVLWEGDAFDTGERGRAAGGTSQIVRQQWTVLLAVRHAGQKAPGAARNESAGPLLAAIHKALAGWIPEGAFRPLQRTQGRRATYTANVALYPLAFDLPLTL